MSALSGLPSQLKKISRSLTRRKMRRRPSTDSDVNSMPRKAILLSRISPLSQSGLEIGALCNPIVTKAESNGGIYYVDFSTAEQSREKYKSDPHVDIDAIVETDFLWGQQSLPELVGENRFDYVIASHVIEHVPNMLGWLREVASVVKDDGILALAIPDKRYTFDFKRDLTSFAALAESYLLDRHRPGVREVFDHNAAFTQVDVTMAWSGLLDPNTLIHTGSLESAWAEAVKYHSSDSYVDVHVNIVTPLSFISLLEAASRLGLLDFAIVDYVDTRRNDLEFFATLQRLPRHLSRSEMTQRRSESIVFARGRCADR